MMELRFAPSDDHDSRSYDLIQKLFGIRSVFLSNASSCWDFVGPTRAGDGHRVIPYTEVPSDDQPLYEDEIRRALERDARLRGGVASPDLLTRYHVVYPPYSEEERQERVRAFRAEIVAKIRAAYGVDLRDALAVDREFKIARIARLVDAHLLKGWTHGGA